VRVSWAWEPPGAGSITIESDWGQRSIPVYSLRNPSHHEPAARDLAAGATAAFYGGLYGIVRAVRPAWDEHEDAETYWRAKPGRPRWSKVPLFMKPQDALRLIDFRLVHPDYRHLERRELFVRLYESHGAPIHVIAPLKEPLRFLHPAFKTNREDLARQAQGDVMAWDRVVAHTTACFFWMADPMWESLATLANLYSGPRVFYGVSSFNEHGKHPPYTFVELLAQVEAGGACQFELVINDDLYEKTGAFSSHTQVRLPMVGEAPELIVVRRGSVGPEWLAASTGYPVRVLDSAGVASRRPGLTDADLQAGLERLRMWRSS